MVGLDPGEFGYVLMFSRAVPTSGGTKLFKLNTIKAFLTGKIPVD
jgi:hypothetical protein